MVEQIRNRLRTAFGDKWLDELKRPLSKEWPDLEESVRRVAASGAVGALPVDEFDYIGVSQFIPVVEAHYEVLFPSAAGASKAEVQQARSSVLRWLKTIKDVRDPMSHPPTADLEFSDAYGTLDAAYRVLQRLDPVAANAVQSLRDQLVPRTAAATSSATGSLEGQMPPKSRYAVEFVGRSRELADLRRWLFDPASRYWALTGEGGKGKTALAYTFATDAKQESPEPLDVILWLSAKQREFREGHITEITPDFTDLESAVNRILTEYGWVDSIEWPLAAKCLTVTELLTKIPALLVLDDIDSAEEVLKFFEVELSRTASKVMVTSRRMPFGWTKCTTQIGGLAGAEADEFIDSRLELMQVPREQFGKEERARLLEVTEGSPLYIEDLLRLCSFGLTPRDAMNRWSRAGGESARRFALEHELDLASSSAKKVLITCALSPFSVSVSELSEITRLTQDDLLEAIADLQRHYLVPAPELLEGTPRFTLNVNVQSLVRAVTANTPVHREIYNAIAQLSDPKIAGERRRADVEAAIRQAIVSHRRGDQEGAEAVLTVGLERHPNNADLLAQLGWLCMRWTPTPRRAEARMLFERAAELHSRREALYYHWADLEDQSENLAAALAIVERGLERVPESLDLRYRLGYARSRGASQLFRENADARAREELARSNAIYEEVLSRAIPRGDRFALATRSKCYEGIVYNSGRVGNDEGVGQTLRRWLRESPEDSYAKAEAARFLQRRPEWATFFPSLSIG